MEPYYYNQMSKAQRTAYHAMKTGLVSLAPSFPVPRLENHELSDIFFKLRLDCPEINFMMPPRFIYLRLITICFNKALQLFYCFRLIVIGADMHHLGAHPLLVPEQTYVGGICLRLFRKTYLFRPFQHFLRDKVRLPDQGGPAELICFLQ